MSESLENAPLRDLCKEATKLIHELTDHVEQNLVPRSRELHTLVRPESPFAQSGQHIEDITVRNSVRVAIESHQFAEKIAAKASEYFDAIDTALIKITQSK